MPLTHAPPLGKWTDRQHEETIDNVRQILLQEIRRSAKDFDQPGKRNGRSYRSGIGQRRLLWNHTAIVRYGYFSCLITE